MPANAFEERLMLCPSEQQWPRAEAVQFAESIDMPFEYALDAVWLSMLCGRVPLATGLVALLQRIHPQGNTSREAFLMGISTQFVLKDNSLVDMVNSHGQSQVLSDSISKVTTFLVQQNLADATRLSMLSMAIILDVAWESVANVHYMGAKGMA